MDAQKGFKPLLHFVSHVNVLRLHRRHQVLYNDASNAVLYLCKEKETPKV